VASKTDNEQMNEIATKDTWKHQPIDNPKRIVIDLHLTDKQFSKLKNGLIPQQMEDKWFIYYENEWLYFHRSWTGNGMYKAKLNKETDGYSITEFWAERNQEKYKNEDDNSDIETFAFLIARGLLGIDVRNIYSNRNIKTETDAVKGWSNFGNMLFTNQGVDYSEEIKSALFGVAVGDALGVPVEFNSRQTISKNPVTDMIGYGTYNLPAGTWSDDSSLTFCLAEALTKDFDLNTIGQNFVKWYHENYWTPHGNVFDIGIATRQAISRLSQGEKPELAGGFDESDNGNGSLMRILPLLFNLLDKPINERYNITKQVSSITHGHIRSVIACFYYLEFAKQIFEGKDKFEIYKNLQTEVSNHLTNLAINPNEIALFDRLLKSEIHKLDEDEIQSSGYVLHTLEASIWSLLTTDNYKGAVLKAVNLGSDTDTTGAVTGGLAGLLYGLDNIPKNWLQQIARYDDIENLAERLADKIASH
jgi:ADP-ribosyl-[dinitrogen reductase] hydrolase